MTQGFYKHLPTDTQNYFVEVGLGNVPGVLSRGFVAKKDSVDTTLEDVWGAPGNISFPVAAETWEIVSDSPNDTVAGSGAQMVLANYLDDQYVEQSEILMLNGTTPVTFAGSPFRPDGAVVILSGSSRANEGELIIRQQGTNLPRQVIKPLTALSADAHLTVPAGKTRLNLKVTPFYPKDQDGRISAIVSPFGSNTDVVPGDSTFYQNAFNIDFRALLPASERTDVSYRASSTNPGAEISLIWEFLVVDNP